MRHVRPGSPRRRIGLSLVLLFAGLGRVRPAGAQVTLLGLPRIPASANTGEKPQSKVWFHAGTWWAVLPSTSVSPSGTWLWRLEPNLRWTNVLRLSSATGTKADAVAVGDLAHVLLHASSSRLVSLEYVAAIDSYAFWSAHPTPTAIALSGSETATIDVDTTGRLWLATESGSNVHVYWGDPPYTALQGPLALASDIAADDIAAVGAIPALGAVGVLWSNQVTRRFGFRLHADGADPTSWEPDEIPAAQSALRVGEGMADDHVHVAVGSDGTLYAAVKTSYETSGFAKIALLVRRPDGRWDDLHPVDTRGTRPIALLNEDAGTIQVAYTTGESGGDIVYRESDLSPIAFGSRRTLLSGSLNNATSTKMNWTDQVVVLAAGFGVLVTRAATVTTTSRPSTTTSTTTSTLPGFTSSTSTSTTSSTTTSAPGTPAPQAVIDADAAVRIGSSIAIGQSALLEVDNDPVKHAYIRFTVSGTAGRAITSAVLRLRVAQVTGAGSDARGRVHRASCGWSEATLSGTTQPQPAIDAAILDAPPGTAGLGQVVEFDVRDAVAGDGTYCVALDALSANGVDYESREAGTGFPAVLVTVAP